MCAEVTYAEAKEDQNIIVNSYLVAQFSETWEGNNTTLSSSMVWKQKKEEITQQRKEK